MKIISIDVGIKNLAFCFLDTEIDNSTNKYKIVNILQWDTINLSQKEELLCCETVKNKNETCICNKPAKFMKDSKMYCLKHSKKQEYQIPSADLKPSFINKQKIQTLFELADKYNIKYTSPIKKPELISVINKYISTTCFEPIESKNASHIDLVTIGKNIQYKFDSLLKDEDMKTIDKIIIENQISPIANRMKTIQGMLAQYFIMKNENVQIDFVNANNKLKVCQDDLLHNEKTESKSKYSDRKKQGVQKCLEIISSDSKYEKWIPVFKNHLKKDDLADSFLQAVWYIIHLIHL